MAYLLGIKIDEIYIYPLGGISKFNMDLNISIKKELLILINGPLFQYLAYLILLIIMPNRKEIINIYHYSILSFNLLPIYPLDGGKLLKLLFNKFINYKNSLKLIINLSYLVTIILFIINKKNISIYLNNYKFKNTKIISDINNLYRDNRHLIKQDNTYYLEKEYLEKIYKKCWLINELLL